MSKDKSLPIEWGTETYSALGVASFLTDKYNSNICECSQEPNLRANPYSQMLDYLEKVLEEQKHSSLFFGSVGNEARKFYDIATCGNVVELFTAVSYDFS